MEHPHPDAGGVVIEGSVDRLRPYFDRRLSGEDLVVGFGPSPTSPGAPADSEFEHRGARCPARRADRRVGLAHEAVARRQRLRWPENSGTHVFNVLRNLGSVIREEYLRATDGPIRGLASPHARRLRRGRPTVSH